MSTTWTKAHRIRNGRLSIDRLLDYLAPVADLAARLYVGKVFFTSGLTKTGNWDTTLFLFREEYNVPLLPPDLAAVVGTGAELVLPILLVVGLFTRVSALGLFLLNIVAIVSYYATLITLGKVFPGNSQTSNFLSARVPADRMVPASQGRQWYRSRLD